MYAENPGEILTTTEPTTSRALIGLRDQLYALALAADDEGRYDDATSYYQRCDTIDSRLAGWHYEALTDR